MPRFAARLARSLLALMLLASSASAGPTTDDSARALSLGREALELYGKSDFVGAFEKFSAADRAAHSPVFVLYMARSQQRAGALLAARALFSSIAEEPLPPGAPEPWARAHDDAATELRALDARIPALILQVLGAPAESVAVTVDGAPVAPAALRAPLRLDPGSHSVVARAPGHRDLSETVRLAENDTAHQLTLRFVPLVAAPVAGVPSTPPSAPQAPGPRRGSLTPGVVALGVGVLGLSAGAITGAMAKGRANEVKANCVDGHCLASDENKAKSAVTLATVSTVTFLAGGAAAAAGVVLVLVRPGGGSGAEARLVPGPASLTLSGSF